MERISIVSTKKLFLGAMEAEGNVSEEIFAIQLDQYTTMLLVLLHEPVEEIFQAEIETELMHKARTSIMSLKT